MSFQHHTQQTNRRARGWPPVCSHAVSERTTSGSNLRGGTWSASTSTSLPNLSHFSSFARNLRKHLGFQHHTQRTNRRARGWPPLCFHEVSEQTTSRPNLPDDTWSASTTTSLLQLTHFSSFARNVRKSLSSQHHTQRTNRRARGWPPLCSHAVSERTTSGPNLRRGTWSASTSTSLPNLSHFSSFARNLRKHLGFQHHTQRTNGRARGWPPLCFHEVSEQTTSGPNLPEDTWSASTTTSLLQLSHFSSSGR
jgi:hypothetical protein